MVKFVSRENLKFGHMHSNRIKSIIAAVLRVDISGISDNSSIIDDFPADSVAFVELLLELEDEFEIKIPDNEAIHLKTVKDVIEYIDQKIPKQE